MSPRSGRRPGEPGTREAILAAARRRFGQHGFAGATIRMIAADAGVDPALVLHYFGTKVDLFAAAASLPVTPSEKLAVAATTDRDKLGETILRTVVEVWENPDGLSAWLALIRSATSDERAAQMMREFITSAVFDPVADMLGEEDARYRMSLAASQIVGLGIVRYVVGVEPLASASTDDLIEAVAPTLQRYLTGPLRSL